MTSPHPGDRLSAYLDDALAAAERAEVDTHLRECAGCRRELEDLALVDSAARSLPVQAPPGYFDALPARVRGRLAGRRRRTVPVWTWAAAAALLLAVLTPLTLRERAAAPRPGMDHAGPAAPAPASAPRAEPAVPASTPAPADALKAETPALSRQAPPPARSREPAAPAAPPAVADREMAQGRLQERDGALAATRASGGKKESEAKVLADRPAPPPAEMREEMAARADEQQAAGGSAGVASPDVLAKSRPAQRAAKAAPEPQAQSDVRRKAAANAAEGTLQGARDEAPAASAPAPAVGQSEEPKRFGADALGLLAQRSQRTAEEARAAARAFEDYARLHPEAATADEARVRAIESWANAWRLGRGAADRERARVLGRAYLAGEGALKDRVRAALAPLSD